MEERMTILSSGARCDVCGYYILPGLSKLVHPFKIQGIDKMLHCDDNCKKILKHACEKQDWKLLPDGPLRQAFEENQLEKQ